VNPRGEVYHIRKFAGKKAFTWDGRDCTEGGLIRRRGAYLYLKVTGPGKSLLTKSV